MGRLFDLVQECARDVPFVSAVDPADRADHSVDKDRHLGQLSVSARAFEDQQDLLSAPHGKGGDTLEDVIDWLESVGVSVDAEGGGTFTVMTDSNQTARQLVQAANNLRIRNKPRLRSFLVEEV